MKCLFESQKMSSENKDNGFTTLGATFDESNNANVELPPQMNDRMFFSYRLLTYRRRGKWRYSH